MADIEINKSDIDEVNDVIQETDEEAYALDSEFTEKKEYKTVQKYELVTILSYLIGVRNEILDHMCSDEYVELLNSLRENKNARILRYLCKARTGLLRNYKKTDNERNVRSFFSLSAFLNSLCQIFLQSISLIGFLPRKIYIGTSEMSVSSGLLVDRTTQIQHFDDTGRSEVKVFTENLNQFFIGKYLFYLFGR